MTREELIELLACAADVVGPRLNEITDEFRSGADLRLLAPLLESDDVELVSLAAYMADEGIPGPRRRAREESHDRELFGRLVELLGHADPAVRWNATGAVAQLVMPQDRDAMSALVKLVVDPARSVRWRAMVELVWIPATTMIPLLGDSELPGLDLVVGSSSPQACLDGACSTNPMERQLALVAIVRNYGADAALLDAAADALDGEAREAFASLRRRYRV